MPENTHRIHWLEMRPAEFFAARDHRPVCYTAFGLAEPHGPYNPLGLDWLKAQGILERAARQHGGIVAPPFAWHITEQPHFPWLESQGIKQTLASSIPADLFLRMVLYQIRAMDARGFRAGILITGHYGGLENDIRLLCEFYTRRTGSPLRLYAAADCELIRREPYHGDHAGVCETSQLLALRPELIDLSRRESPDDPWAGHDFEAPGVERPSAELGEEIVTSQVKRLGEIVGELLSDYVHQEGWAAPNMPETESLWHRFEQSTRKYWWCSLTLEQLTRGELLEFPGWEALGE